MATSNTAPIVIPQPFAAQATSENINVIPNGATGTNGASFQEGFPAITRMPVIENPLPTQVSGLPPKQQDFNGIFNVVSQHNFFAQNGGTYSFNQAVSDAIGGYAKNQILWYFPANGFPIPVVSMIDNNTYNFAETPSYIDGEKWSYIVADTSLDNLNATGQAKFDAKANTDLSNCTKPYITETFRRRTEWYRIYSDSFIEQGGMVTSNSGTITYNFITPFADTNYSLLCTQNSGGIGPLSNGMVISKVSNTQFSVIFTAESTGIIYTWYAYGY